jgi:CHAT domain-containing protein
MLSLIVYDSGNNKMVELRSHNYENMEFSFLSGAGGVYCVEIKSLERDKIPRIFRIKIDPPRSAQKKDLNDVTAHQLLATASVLRSEWTITSLKRSLADYLDARSIWQSIGNYQRAGQCALAAAGIHFVLGEYRESLHWAKNAASDSAKAGGGLQEAEAFSRVGQLYSLLGDNKQGRAFSKKALSYFYFNGAKQQTDKLKQKYAEALTRAGEVYNSMGDLVSSSDSLEKSLKLVNEVGDRGGEARCRLFLGYISATIGDAEVAKTQFQRSLDLSRAIGDRTNEALSLTATGIAHSLMRDDETAIKLHRNAMEIFRTIGDRQSEGITLNGVGQAYQHLNEAGAALAHYRNALKIFEESGNLDFASVALYQIAKVYESSGDSKNALFYYQRCSRLSRGARKQRMLAYALNEIAVLRASKANPATGFGEYRKLLKFYQGVNDRRGQALILNNIGDIYLTVSRRSEALRAYTQALPLSQKAGERGVEISTLYNIAKVEKEMGRVSEALASIRESIEIIEALRSNVTSPDFRSSYLSSQRKHYELYIDLLMQLNTQQPGKDFASTALLVSESSRARSLCEILVEGGIDLRQGVKPEVLQREKELQNLLRAEAQYQSQLGGSDEEYAREATPKVDLLRAEYEEIQSQIRKQNPRYEALLHPKPLSVADIQTQLTDDKTMVLEYFLGSDRSYLWAITATSLKGYTLPGRAVLESAAFEVYKLLTARQFVNGQVDDGYQVRVETADRQYYQAALRLSQMLLKPVVNDLEDKRLVIVSEGILQYLPFDALPIPGAETTNEIRQTSDLTNGSLLISRHEVISLPSISALSMIRSATHHRESSDKAVAIFADPVFSSTDDRVLMKKPELLSSPGNSSKVQTSELKQPAPEHLGRLMHTSEEADEIASASPGPTWVAKGFAANRDNVLSDQLVQYRIVHFATHGVINTEHPELSGIVLSMMKPDGSRENGYLQLHDIYALKLFADLTVLSACDTALGKDVKGEGLIGLTRGFMYAGSRSVVASLWKVDDRATAVLMKHFYRNMLQNGLPPGAALRSAKELVRKEPGWDAPYFWAGFVLQGEYLQQIRVNDRSRARELVIISVLSALLLLGSASFILLRRSCRRRQSMSRYA